MNARDAHVRWRTLPLAAPLDVLSGGRTLILAPHPDDESLGCGGIIAALCAAGAAPVVVVLTDGARSHPNSRLYPPERLRWVRRAETAEATAALGLPPDALHFLDVPDSRAPTEGPAFEAAVGTLAECAADCTTILATWPGDPHCDHVAADSTARAVAARTGMRHLAYPIWGWTLAPDVHVPDSACGGVEGWRIDISGHLQAKRRAIGCYASQLGTLITDDPDNIVLPPAMLAHFELPYEVLLRA